jgi:hypothetical protein
MALFSDDVVYTDRLRPSANYFETLWTGITSAGHRHFKSTWFSATTVDEEPPRNRDVEYNTRAVKALRYLAWKTGDPHVLQRLIEWADAWLADAERTDKGKPRGIIPASVRYPDEAINGDEQTWYRANMFWEYYDWAHYGGSTLLEQLLFTYSLTGNESYLEPLRAALTLVETKSVQGTPAPGSPACAARVLTDNTRFWSVASQWRLLTGDTRFDSLLVQFGTPYLRYRMTGDETLLTTGLHEILDKIRYNTPLFTYEAIHTDRVYVTDSGSGSTHLKAMLTGDGLIEDMSPYPAVTWANTDPSFTALVENAGASQLDVQLFVFSDAGLNVTARLWQLEPGAYELTVRDETSTVHSSTLNQAEPGQAVDVYLPGRRKLYLSIHRR